MNNRTPIITLLTDFGTQDHFAAAMKGVMYKINPNIEIVDISHEVAPHDTLEAGFLLRSCYSYFPSRTIHVVVVDPTVGSSRKALIVATDNYYFLAPDNGVLSLIYDVEEVSGVVEITAEHYILSDVSKTFHGRDIFAPAAAWLSKDIDISNFGDPVEEYVKLSLPKAKMVGESLLKGAVIHVDRFGNLITNISQTDLEEARAKIKGGNLTVVIAKQEIKGLKQFYAEGQKGEFIALFGSTNFLEIAQNQGSAAKALGLIRGAEVGVLLK
jgi:Uncharacterized conserved protein